jgi:hypothetical protein
MVQRISKKSKTKYGLSPGYTPKMLNQKTDEANIPLWQHDGSVKFVSQKDFDWLIANKLLDPTVIGNEANPPSQT